MKAEFLEPESLSEAMALLENYAEDAKIIGGGTAIVLMLQQKLIAPQVLVSLGRVPDLDYIRQGPAGLQIGALVRLRDAHRSPALKRFCPALAHSIGIVGNVRVRNQATIGGNLAEADYASDPPAMFLALDARVKVASTRGRREIPLSEFYLGFYTTALDPDEFLGEIVVPALPASPRSVYLKYSSRSAEDRPCVGVAAVAGLTPDGRCHDLRVAVGAALETPQRLPEVEALAQGEALTDELIGTIAAGYAQALEPISDARGSAWYRREMIHVFVRRALVELRNGHR